MDLRYETQADLRDLALVSGNRVEEYNLPRLDAVSISFESVWECHHVSRVVAGNM